MKPYVFILIFSIADHFLTYWELNQGIVQEANPLMANIVAMPVIISFSLRIPWILLMLFLLWNLSRLRQVYVKHSVMALVLVYGMVTIYHFIIILLSKAS